MVPEVVASDKATRARATPKVPFWGLYVLQKSDTKRNSYYLLCTELYIHSPPNCTHKVKLSIINFLQKKMCMSAVRHQPVGLSCLVHECCYFMQNSEFGLSSMAIYGEKENARASQTSSLSASKLKKNILKIHQKNKTYNIKKKKHQSNSYRANLGNQE